MQRFLVIGGTGVAGTAAIRAVRERFGAAAHVTAVWYGRRPEAITIDGADAVVYGDATSPEAWDRIEAESGKAFAGLFYATAMGEVGFPAGRATPEQIAASDRVSFDPIPRLEDRFDVGMVVAYSTFFNLAHQLVTYGAMAHSKAAIERWAAEPGPGRRVCIRAGAFASASSHAIKLLVRRNAGKLAEMDDPILREYFAGAKASEAVEHLQAAVFAEERERYGDTHTGPEGLLAAHLRVFDDPEARFVCVCGKTVWVDTEPQGRVLA